MRRVIFIYSIHGLLIYALKMIKTLKIFNSIKKELKQFETLFDSYVEGLEFSDYLKGAKGKMLRPALTMVGAKIGGEIKEESLWAAISVELMHNATLVHDDVVDNADMRRDKPTFKHFYGDKQAVLYGDYLLAKSLDCVIRTGKLSIVNTIAHTTGEMSIGEIEQLEQSGTLETSEDEYFEIIYKKTATLFVCSLLVGYYSSTSEDALEETVKTVAYNLGMAFQVKDDLLDYDTSGSSGKVYGNDIREKKMTLPLISALRQANEADAQEIKKMILLPEIPDRELLKIISFVETNGGLEYTEMVLEKYLNQAREAIATLPEGDSKSGLNYLCKYLGERKK